MSATQSSTDPDPTTGGDAAACSARGLAALAAGQFAEARQWAARCLAAPGGASDAGCALLAGRLALEEGELDDAVEQLRRAQILAPGDGAIARVLGEALAANGASREARAVIEEAARRAPRDADILVDLAFLCLLDRDWLAAREAIERAAACAPGSHDVLLAQARVYEALGEAALAAAAANQVAAATSSPAVLGDLVRLFLTADRYPEAEAAFRKLQAIDPEHALFAQHGRIWCRIQAGDWRSALELAVSATHADRYELTTELLAYARDRLFTQVPDAEIVAREAALRERLLLAVREHAEQHRVGGEPLTAEPAAAWSSDGARR